MKLQCISDLAVAEALHDFDCVQSRTHFIPFVLILLNFSLIFIKLVPFFFISSELTGEQDDMDAKLNWLKCHTHPNKQVTSWMAETCKSRALFVRKDKQVPTADLLKQFPRLVDTDGMVWFQKINILYHM